MAGDNRHDYADIKKIEKKIGWHPKYELEEGLKNLVKWSKEEEAHDYFNVAENERKKILGK